MSNPFATSGKKAYGLLPKAGAASAAAPQRRTLMPKAAFRDLDDDDDDTEPAASSAGKSGDVSRVNTLIRTSGSSHSSGNAAGDDSSIYDYDGAYESFSSAHTAASHPLSSGSSSAPLAGQPRAKYVGNLMATAKVREKEKDRIYERKLLKEREAEDAEFAEQPQYITSAYKQKLIETQKWEYEDKLTEELEKKTDVRAQGMQGFYANLLTKNISMGSDIEKNSVSAYTAGSKRQRGMEEQERATHEQNIGARKDARTEPQPAAAEAAASSNLQAARERYMAATAGAAPAASAAAPAAMEAAAPAATAAAINASAIQSARERYLARKAGTSSAAP